MPQTLETQLFHQCLAHGPCHLFKFRSPLTGVSACPRLGLQFSALSLEHSTSFRSVLATRADISSPSLQAQADLHSRRSGLGDPLPGPSGNSCPACPVAVALCSFLRASDPSPENGILTIPQKSICAPKFWSYADSLGSSAHWRPHGWGLAAFGWVALLCLSSSKLARVWSRGDDWGQESHLHQEETGPSRGLGSEFAYHHLCPISQNRSEDPPIQGVGGFRLHLFTEKCSKGAWQRLWVSRGG